MSEPRQKRHRSNQVVGTPSEFLEAVGSHFGPITLDLAANEQNHVAAKWYGPGGLAEDALAPDVRWSTDEGMCWLNPPFSNIAPWAEKFSKEWKHGRIAMLTPASVGSNWFADYVHERARVLALRPRLQFVGSKDPYPKDLMLSVIGPFVRPGFDVWRWDR